MNELLARLKRFFQASPPRPSESVGEATTDRPPPRLVEPPPIEPVPSREPTAVPPREPTTVDADDLAEVRAALEAVADTPVALPESRAEHIGPGPQVSEPIPEPVPEPAADFPSAVPSEAPASPEPIAAIASSAPMPEAVDVPIDVPPPAAERVGDALVLTLATPQVTFTVDETSATLGRGQENSIRLDDLSVSRRHARIAYRQGGYWINDLGSMGGTWVEGTRLTAPRRLAGGEVIDIGLLRLTVGFAGGSASAETTSAKAEMKKNSKPRSETAGQVRRRR